MKKILVIEDDIDTINMVGLLLQESGYSIVKISRAITVGEIAEISPDLVIIDFLLPFGLGDDICMDIKNHEATKNIPVILYSASPNLERIVSNCKAEAFIAKPFDLEHFVNVVNTFIKA